MFLRLCFLCILPLIWAGCPEPPVEEEKPPEPSGPGQGREGGPCGPGGECFSGLTCEEEVCVPSGDIDGSSDGSSVVDAGSSDGSSDGSIAMDAGSSDGSSDGTLPVDAGSATGSSDGMIDGMSAPDAGESDGTSDGSGAEDAGNGDGNVVDAGSGEEDSGGLGSGFDAGKEDSGGLDSGFDAGEEGIGSLDSGFDGGEVDSGVICDSCPMGRTLNEEDCTCIDIDECENNHGNCHVNAHCENSADSGQEPTCFCMEGYYGDGAYQGDGCTPWSLCHAQASETTPPTTTEDRICACEPHYYEGDGFDCTAVCGNGLESIHSCDFRLGQMAGYPSEDYSDFGIEGLATFIHGYAIKAPSSGNIGEEAALNQFWNATQESVESALESYCASKVVPQCDSEAGACCAQVTGLVVLDIENPFHPKKFHRYAAIQEEVGWVNWQGDETARVACSVDQCAEGNDGGICTCEANHSCLYASDGAEYCGTPLYSFEELVDAYKMRINAARAVFPQAEIGLYGVTVSTGVPSFSDTAKTFLSQAVQQGLLDDLDFVLPVLYPRFGPSDGNYSLAHAKTYTDFSMTLTGEILSHMTQPIPMIPALSPVIFNGNSSNHGETAPSEYVAAQIAALQEGQYADTILFWVGSESAVPGGTANFFAGLKPALKDCLCEGQWAKESPADITCEGPTQPLLAYSWEDTLNTSYVLNSYTASFGGPGGQTSVSAIDGFYLETAKEKLCAMAPGHRAIVWRGWGNEIYPHDHPDDHLTAAGLPSLWWDNGVQEGQSKAQAFFESLANHNCDDGPLGVDYVLVDVEVGMSNWRLGNCYNDRCNLTDCTDDDDGTACSCEQEQACKPVSNGSSYCYQKTTCDLSDCTDNDGNTPCPCTPDYPCTLDVDDAQTYCYARTGNGATYEAMAKDARYHDIIDEVSLSIPEFIGSTCATENNPHENCEPNWLVDNVCHWMQGGLAYQKWNKLMGTRRDIYMHEMLYEAAAPSFPNVVMSNYGATLSVDPDYFVPGQNYHPACECEDMGHVVGTHQAREIYGRINQLRYQGIEDDDVYFAPTPFNSFNMAVNQTRRMPLASKEKPFHVWMPPSYWSESGTYIQAYDGTEGTFDKTAYANTDYWQETLFHAALSGPSLFIYWNNQSGMTADPDGLAVNEHQKLDQVLGELDAMMGCAHRMASIYDLSDWDAPYALTGMRVEGRRLWRFTPEVEVEKLETETSYSYQAADFVTSTVPPILEMVIGDETTTITFPEGEIYLPSNPNSELGMWILQWSTSPVPTIDIQTNE